MNRFNPIAFVGAIVLLTISVSSVSQETKNFDFKNVRVRHTGAAVVLEDTVSEAQPVNICPNATFERCDIINVENQYAVMVSKNMYFIVNTKGAISFPMDDFPDAYDISTGNIFVKRQQKQKTPALYNFEGMELGKLSKYEYAYQEFDMETNACYFFFLNSKKLKGVMNSNGELLLACEYADIGTISGGKCEIWRKTDSEPEVIDLKSLKPINWK